MGSKEGKTGIVREVLSFFLYVAIVVGITFLIIHFVGQRTYVSGSSMENTLSDGDVEETGILIAVNEILEDKRVRHIESFVKQHPEAMKITSGAHPILTK